MVSNYTYLLQNEFYNRVDGNVLLWIVYTIHWSGYGVSIVGIAAIPGIVYTIYWSGYGVSIVGIAAIPAR